MLQLSMSAVADLIGIISSAFFLNQIFFPSFSPVFGLLCKQLFPYDMTCSLPEIQLACD